MDNLLFSTQDTYTLHNKSSFVIGLGIGRPHRAPQRFLKLEQLWALFLQFTIQDDFKNITVTTNGNVKQF
jgi:hypothetical protein